MAALSTGVATMSSLAQLWVQDTEKQRQHRRNDTSLREETPETSSYLWCLQSS